MPVLQCGHVAEAPAGLVCEHLLTANDPDYVRRFTGRGTAFELVCGPCSTGPNPPNPRTACPVCFNRVTTEGSCEGIVGEPQVRQRASGLRFSHESVTLPGLPVERLADVCPVAGNDRNLWLAVDHDGRVYRLDLDRPSTEVIARVPDRPIGLGDPLSLYASARGRFAAVVNTFGQAGFVLDLTGGRVSMVLARDGYHVEHSAFPVAFCESGGREVLIHGTAWNRLDVSDPLTGELLTPREYAPADRAGPRPEHYLDYFHCRMCVSPTGEYVAEEGWVWHPVGVVSSWSVRRWLDGNPWESEDGPSRRSLCHRNYYWDGPLCWLDGRRLAVYGHGEDVEWLLPAVRVFDVVTGLEETWFAGPQGQLAFDGYLYSFGSARGTEVWDVATGERLLVEDYPPMRSYGPNLRPVHYHPGSKLFLSLVPGGPHVVRRLRGRPLAPGCLTEDVLGVARSIRRERAFGRLPILADALLDAGCTDEEVLAHCRQPGEHGRDCWVVDRILDAE